MDLSCKCGTRDGGSGCVIFRIFLLRRSSLLFRVQWHISRLVFGSLGCRGVTGFEATVLAGRTGGCRIPLVRLVEYFGKIGRRFLEGRRNRIKSRPRGTRDGELTRRHVGQQAARLLSVGVGRDKSELCQSQCIQTRREQQLRSMSRVPLVVREVARPQVGREWQWAAARRSIWDGKAEDRPRSRAGARRQNLAAEPLSRGGRPSFGEESTH